MNHLKANVEIKAEVKKIEKEINNKPLSSIKKIVKAGTTNTKIYRLLESRNHF